LEALPPGRSATLAFAALLHDVGKPPTFTRAPDRIRFHGHDSEGAKIADAILRRLKFPTSEREAVVAIVRRHMQFLSLPEMRPARAARFLAGPFIEEELALHRADCLASNGDLSTLEFARRRLEEARACWQAPLPPPLLRGDDLLALGYRRGPRIGQILRALQERQIEGALHNTEEARTWVLQAFPLETSPA
jgi:poly(A) polymerase